MELDMNVRMIDDGGEDDDDDDNSEDRGAHPRQLTAAETRRGRGCSVEPCDATPCRPPPREDHGAVSRTTPGPERVSLRDIA